MIDTNNMTLCLIKPDLYKRNFGSAIDDIRAAGFIIVEMKQIWLSLDQAQEFYAEHKSRPFFDGMTQDMIQSPIIAMALTYNNEGGDEKEITSRFREKLGATNPAEAANDTLRKKYGLSIGQNSFHGSDSPASAHREINQMFESFCKTK